MASSASRAGNRPARRRPKPAEPPSAPTPPQPENPPLDAWLRLGLSLSAGLEPAAAAEQVLAEIQPLLGADRAALLLLDEDDLVLTACRGGAPDGIGGRMPANAGLAGRALRARAPVVAAEAADGAGLIPQVEAFGPAPGAAVWAAPLVWLGRPLGVLEAVYTTAPAGRPDPAERLQAACGWAAAALGAARQHAAGQRRLRESEAIRAVRRALGAAHPLDQILSMIVEAVRSVIPPVERAVIHLLDPDGRTLSPAARSSRGPDDGPEPALRLGEGAAGQALAAGRPVHVADVQTDLGAWPAGQAGRVRSLLVAPILSGDQPLGVISVISAQTHAFGAEDEELLSALGLPAALAVENARLLAAERAARHEAETLGEISRTLSSTLVFEQVLDRLLEQVGRMVPYDAGLLLLVEPGTGRARAARQRGFERFGPPALQAARDLDLDVAAHPRLRRLAAGGQPLALEAAEAEPGGLPPEAGLPTRSWLGAPILGHPPGAAAFFWLEKSEPGYYGAEHVRRLGAVLGPAALAVQNARLYANLERLLRHEQSVRARLVQTEKLAAMGQLVAAVAHELTNPLQAIQNALFLVKQEAALDPQARQDLQVAVTEADRMADLVSRLRETLRPAAAEQYRPEPLNDLVVEVQRLIATHLRQRRVEFVLEPAPSLPPVPGIRDQLKQVLLNLCLNAVEAMPAGGRLSVQTRHLPELGELLVSVSDTGLGIDPADLPRLFEPFYTKKDGGIGLGLFITHEIIQRHQGRIDVDSRPGHGSTFRVWLPLARTEAGPVP